MVDVFGGAFGASATSPLDLGTAEKGRKKTGPKAGFFYDTS